MGGPVAAFAVTCLILIATPGPSVLFIIGRALAGGFRLAAVTALGNAFGSAITGLIVTLVLGAIIEAVPLVGVVPRFVGAGVLVLLGVLSIARGVRRRPSTAAESAPSVDTTKQKPATAFISAATVGATNPKTFILFAGVLPGFVAAGGTWWTPVTLVPIPVGIGLVTDMLWAVAATAAAAWITRSANGQKMLEIGGGCLLVLLGIYTAIMM